MRPGGMREAIKSGHPQVGRDKREGDLNYVQPMVGRPYGGRALRKAGDAPLPAPAGK